MKMNFFEIIKTILRQTDITDDEQRQFINGVTEQSTIKDLNDIATNYIKKIFKVVNKESAFEFDDLKDSLSVQIAKGAKIRKFTVGKVYPRERTKVVAV